MTAPKQSTINYAIEVLWLLVNKLSDHHFYPKAEYSEKTRPLGYKLMPPLDVEDHLSQEVLEKAACEIALLIREHGYETPVDLPMPRAIDIGQHASDPKTGLSVRYVRMFDPIDGCFVAWFHVGMQL